MDEVKASLLKNLTFLALFPFLLLDLRYLVIYSHHLQSRFAVIPE